MPRPPSTPRRSASSGGLLARARVVAQAAARRLGLVPLSLGARGERHAARFLRRAGYAIIDRNRYIGPGEADLIALAPDGLTIVIVEVKTRAIGDGHPPPEQSITARKRAKLLAVARAVAVRGKWLDRPLRIDVIAIDWPTGRGVPHLRHYPNAVTG